MKTMEKALAFIAEFGHTFNAQVSKPRPYDGRGKEMFDGR